MVKLSAAKTMIMSIKKLVNINNRIMSTAENSEYGNGNNKH